jgi:hypothetical protein
MRVDAASVPASTILALVATLGLVALLICLVRVCAAGRAGWRSMRGLRAEEGVILFAAVSFFDPWNEMDGCVVCERG